ncbi:hypothetical protein BC826DRAFT_35485 [Russula brevipes]|nr:hypothetical protein BC826DRAFT_35485 [Russula brevipes]
MPSILSRLRTRAVSQSSRQSAPSVLPAPTPSTTVTTPTPIVRTPGEQPASEPPIQETAPVTRKIYPDLDLLPEELVSEPPPARRGLPPPVRRGLLTASNIPTTTQQPNALSAPGDTDSPKASRSSSPSGAGDITPSESGFIQRLGNWSTFGRRRAPPPSLNEFGEHISPSPSAWRTRRANSRLSSRPSSKTTTSTHSSPHENKESTPRLSSQSSSGRRTPAAAAARSNSYSRFRLPSCTNSGSTRRGRSGTRVPRSQCLALAPHHHRCHRWTTPPCTPRHGRRRSRPVRGARTRRTMTGLHLFNTRSGGHCDLIVVFQECSIFSEQDRTRAGTTKTTDGRAMRWRRTAEETRGTCLFPRSPRGRLRSTRDLIIPPLIQSPHHPLLPLLLLPPPIFQIRFQPLSLSAPSTLTTL